MAKDPLEKVALDGPEKLMYISSLLSNEESEQLQLVMLNKIDVFAYSHSNMIGINPTLASNKLNKKVRCFHLARYQIIQTEVDNLLRAGFIREMKYPNG